MNGPPQLLSVTRVAEILDCSRGHVYDLIAAKKLRSVEIKATGSRSKTRLFAEDVEAFIVANTTVRTRRGGVAGEARHHDGT